MSYILEALKKERKEQQSEDQLPSVHTPIISVAPQEKQSSIAWGILLTIAIFIALFAGFKLGQQNESIADIPVEAKQSKALETAGNDVKKSTISIASDNVLESATNNESQINDGTLVANKPVKRISAESYFDSPPINIPATKEEATNPLPHKVIEETNIVNEPVKEVKLQAEPINGVSEDLLALVQSAIDETEQDSQQNTQQAEIHEQPVASLTEMPLWVQKGVPSLQFEMHIYNSDDGGWVRVNGKDRYQGDRISEGLFIDQILPQKVILNFQGETFSLPALTHWEK